MRRAVDCQPPVPARGAAQPADRTVSPERTTRRRPKSEGCTPGSIRQLRPTVTRARHHGALADQRDAGVQALRLLAVRPQIGPVPDARSVPDAAVLVDDGVVQHRPLPDRGVEHHDRVAHHRIGADPHARRQDAVLHRAIDHAAMAHHAAGHGRPWADARRRPLLALGVDQPAQVVELDGRRVRQQVQARAPVALHRADVLPVALELVAVDATLRLDHPRQQVAPEVHAVGSEHLAQGRPRRTRTRPCSPGCWWRFGGFSTNAVTRPSASVSRIPKRWASSSGTVRTAQVTSACLARCVSMNGR